MRDKGAAIGWMADEGLFGRPRGMRNDVDLVAVVVDQANGLAFAGQSVADFSVVGIDGDSESRRVATAKEDDVRAGFNDGVDGELEGVLSVPCCRLAASQPRR